MLFFRLVATHAIAVILTLIFAALANLVLHPTLTSSIYARHVDGVSTFLPDVGIRRELTKTDVANQGGFVTIKFVAVSKTPLSSSSLQSGNDKLQGTLIVTTKVINNSTDAKKKPSDFTLTIHGNDPSPSSFLGNSSGTHVRLHMGMYSTSVSGPLGYNSTFSGDCSGGMMAVETKECTITNSVPSNPHQ